MEPLCSLIMQSAFIELEAPFGLWFYERFNDHAWIPLMYHFEMLSTWVAEVRGEHHFCPH